MSETIQGTVTAANCKPRGKKGMKSTGLQIDGVWYNVFAKDDFSNYEGGDVSFEATEGEYGWDVDVKTLKLHKDKPPAQTRAAASASSGSTRSGGPLGPTIGNALNNATLLIVHKLVPIGAEGVAAVLEKTTRGILALAEKLSRPAAAPVAQAPPPPPPTPEPSFEDDDIPF